eukprot:418444-Hanusia_phi.AAC.1
MTATLTSWSQNLIHTSYADPIRISKSPARFDGSLRPYGTGWGSVAGSFYVRSTKGRAARFKKRPLCPFPHTLREAHTTSTLCSYTGLRGASPLPSPSASFCLSPEDLPYPTCAATPSASNA